MCDSEFICIEFMSDLLIPLSCIIDFDLHGQPQFGQTSLGELESGSS